jgi:hypothetical protein
MVSMLALAAVIAAVVIVFFPQCLASPYADMDERIRTYWLADVVGAQPFWSVAIHQPKLMAARYVTPFIAILLIGFQLRSRRLRREEILVAILLVVAFGVSLWQVRGSTFSVAFAKAFATLDNVRVGPKPIRVGRPTDRAISSRTACAATTLPRPSGSTGSRKKLSSIEEISTISE